MPSGEGWLATEQKALEAWAQKKEKEMDTDYLKVDSQVIPSISLGVGKLVTADDNVANRLNRIVTHLTEVSGVLDNIEGNVTEADENPANYFGVEGATSAIEEWVSHIDNKARRILSRLGNL